MLFFFSEGLPLSLEAENKLNGIDLSKSLCMWQWTRVYQQDCSAWEKQQWHGLRLGGTGECLVLS